MKFRFAAALTLACITAAPAHADQVSDWYELQAAIAKAAQPSDGSFDKKTYLDSAHLTLAMFEAANAIDRRYESYVKLAPAAKTASAEAAVATAAHDVLINDYPDQATLINNAYRQSLVDIAPAARDAGVAVGQAAAKAALLTSGWDEKLAAGQYRPNGAPGAFVPVSIPFSPEIVQYRPFFLKRLDELRPGPPVALSSPEWAKAVDEVRRVGAKASTERTEEQTIRAKFWINYNVAPLLRQIAGRNGRSLVQNARMYALVEVGGNDAGLVIVEAKAHYGFWRPLSAIRTADTDGNDATTADPAWVPLIRTPGQPEYPCGHCTWASYMAGVLGPENGIGPDGIHFTNDDMPGMFVTVRDWPTFVTWVSDSRIQAGVHFRTTNDISIPLGQSISKMVLERFAQPLKK